MPVPLLISPFRLSDGEKRTIAAYQGAKLSIIARVGATVVVSRVNGAEADAHIEDAGQFSVASNTIETIDVDWPFYHISVTGAACRVALT